MPAPMTFLQHPRLCPHDLVFVLDEVLDALEAILADAHQQPLVDVDVPVRVV